MEDNWVLQYNIYPFNINLLNGDNFFFKDYMNYICIFVNVASK